MRTHDSLHRCGDNDHSNDDGNEWIEESAAEENHTQARHDRCQRNKDVPQVVDVSQANRDIFFARLSKSAGDPPIAGRGEQTRNYGNKPEDWLRMDQALDRLPHKNPADDQQTNRIEDVRRSKEVAGETGTQRIGQE